MSQEDQRAMLQNPGETSNGIHHYYLGSFQRNQHQKAGDGAVQMGTSGALQLPEDQQYDHHVTPTSLAMATLQERTAQTKITMMC